MYFLLGMEGVNMTLFNALNGPAMQGLTLPPFS